MSRDEVIRHLIERLAALQATACEVDYGRIEELCHLICAAMNDFRSLPARSII